MIPAPSQNSTLPTANTPSPSTLINPIDSPIIEQLKKLRFTIYGNYLEKEIVKKLNQFAEKLAIKNSRTQSKNNQFTVYQVIACQILRSLQELGISIDLLRVIYIWLTEKDVVLTNVIYLVRGGYRTFLIIDSDGKSAIWTDVDLADYLFLGSENRKSSDVIICLNSIINDTLENLGFEQQPVKYNLFYTHREYIQELKLIWDDQLKIQQQEDT